MPSLNKVELIGHLGKDAETQYTPSGVAKTKFSLATSRRWKDNQSGEWKEETDWHNVVAWKRENIADRLLKGVLVRIEGRIHSYSYENKQGEKRYVTEIIAEDVMLFDRVGERMAERPASAPKASSAPVDDESIPF